MLVIYISFLGIGTGMVCKMLTHGYTTTCTAVSWVCTGMRSKILFLLFLLLFYYFTHYMKGKVITMWKTLYVSGLRTDHLLLFGLACSLWNLRSLSLSRSCCQLLSPSLWLLPLCNHSVTIRWHHRCHCLGPALCCAPTCEKGCHVTGCQRLPAWLEEGKEGDKGEGWGGVKKSKSTTSLLALQSQPDRTSAPSGARCIFFLFLYLLTHCRYI